MGDATAHCDDPSREGLDQGSDVICLNGSRRSALSREASRGDEPQAPHPPTWSERSGGRRRSTLTDDI